MWTLIAGYFSKLILNWQALALLLGCLGLAVMISLLRRSGKQSAELEQLQEWSKYQAQRAKDRANIQAMRNNDVRDSLRKRWSRKQ